MMSPLHPPSSSGAYDGRSISSRSIPLQIIHIIGNILRIWSVYSLYHTLSQQGDSVVVFIFTCLVLASIIFLLLQKPWRGWALPNTQVAPTIINGGIMALYFVLWGKGLMSCGPLTTLLAEYAGAILGVLSALLYGRRISIWKKVGGLIAMLISFYLLSRGWATRTFTPFYTIGPDPVFLVKQPAGIREMLVLICAGILSALRRVIARRLSLKNQLKRRLHAVTVASATCFLFPLAMRDKILGSKSGSIITIQWPSWAFISTIFFGMVFIFYVDNIAEERLHIVFSSPRHLLVAGGCIIVMEIFYKMDFSLIGFLVCSLILALGIHEVTALDRTRRGHFDPHEVLDGDQLQTSLPS